ncbi:MAG: hypothetical protein LBG90_01290 [Spirochaetaceae bacterium]|jgi:hypothetical protein|nr:hypothetical protein [Spirochaetaceae bacterium]
MTEEEADYGDEYFTEHLPKVDPSKGGVTSRQSFRIIGELARKEIASAV